MISNQTLSLDFVILNFSKHFDNFLAKLILSGEEQMIYPTGHVTSDFVIFANDHGG